MVGRGIALLFHDRGTRRGWVVSSTPRPHFTPGKDPVPILREAGWAPGPVWTGGKSRPHRDSIPDRPARSQALYRLNYPAHTHTHTHTCVCKYIYMYTGWAKSRYTLIAYYYIMHTNFWPTLYIGLLSYDALLRSKLFLCPWHEIILINHFPLLAVIVEDDW